MGMRASTRFALAVLALSVASYVVIMRAGGTWPYASLYPIATKNAYPDRGLAYIAPLPRADLDPDHANLYEGTVRPADPLRAVEGLFGWSRLYYYLNGLIRRRFPDLATATTWSAVGPGKSMHDDIRAQGNGRFSVWQNALYFSASDGSDPRANGRVYRLEVRYPVPAWLPRTLLVLAALAAGVVGVAALRSVSWLRPLVPGVAITLVMLAVIFAGAEAWLRVKIPFLEVAWPSTLHPVAGFHFKPGSEVRFTNHADFWARERANSLGFLDREPVVPKPPGTFRILVLGDSFVEAAQVAIPRKFPRLLEERLRHDFPGRKIDVVALGYSGTGQANQLGFYEAFGRALQPDLVMLVVVNNDYANNSPILESVRNGWHPYHPPFLYFEVDAAAPGFRRIEVDPDWNKHLIQNATGNVAADYAARIAILRREPAFAKALEGWRYPDDFDFDGMFCAEDMPAVFRQATSLTDHAFAQFAEAGRRDGFRVLVVAANNVTNLCRAADARIRALHPGGLIARVKESTRKAGLPLWDLHPAFAAKAHPADAVFRYDSHWSETGHEWVAEALADMFRRDPAMLAKK